MALLKLAVNNTAYLKTGFLGFEGSGKTRTAVEIAIGMTKLVKGKKVAFFDTEKGSDFHIERFKAEGLELHTVKSKTFIDLIDTIREAEKNGFSFIIIDSITHVWRELMESYLKKKNKDRMSMPDWGILKKEWAQYTDLYVNSKIHIAMLGRAGHEYDVGEDDDGKMEVHKAGTKMKVETETGYEPDLLIEMLKVRKSDVEPTTKGSKKDKKASGFINRAVVIKDRTDTMNGVSIDMPTFKSFEPIMQFLNIGGEHVGTDSTRSSQSMFGNPDRSLNELTKQRDMALEELQDVLALAGLKGTSGEAVAKRTKALVDHFGGSGTTYLSNARLEDLRDGIIKLRREFKIEKAVKPGMKVEKTTEETLTAEDSAL